NEDTQPFVPQPGPSKPESSYANLEEDHQDRTVTIIDTERISAPQGNVEQYKEVPQVVAPSYNRPLKIRPIQVEPSSYDVSPAPIKPYAPQPALQRISIQPQLGYQGPSSGNGYQQQGGYVPPQQTGGYIPPQQTGNYVPPPPAGGYVPPPQTFQPPPPPILQPQPIQFPAPPPYQPLPTYQLPQHQPQPQPGCCGGQLFSQQGSLCMPMSFNPCQRQQPFGGGACGVCSSACPSACAPAQGCNTGGCCSVRVCSYRVNFLGHY
ncbi:unnamed protein product, partial [Cylicostephanus goldi]